MSNIKPPLNLLLLLSLFLKLSCSSTRPEGRSEAEVLYKEAQALMKDGRYILATEKLNLLKNRYPYSIYSTPSELLLSDILFEQENYIEAAASYLIFRDFHPTHEKIPYVIYKIAESYYKQVPDTYDRDLQPANEAIKYFMELKMKYPNNKYSLKANKKISKCKEMLRDKEQYIADFYFKVENFEAALWRYLNILENFKHKKLRSHSAERAILSAKKLEKWNECKAYSMQFVDMIDRKNKSLLDAIELCQSK